MALFGDQKEFAIEVALEAEPSARFMGNEPLGRIRAWVGGHPFGAWDDPSCPFSELAAELRDKADANYSAWHPNLGLKAPFQRFEALDALIFHPDCADRIPTTLDAASILTNTVECFDGVKAFALTPSADAVQILISNQRGLFADAVVSKDLLRLVAIELAEWIRSNRRDA